jgi:hypothetical protein
MPADVRRLATNVVRLTPEVFIFVQRLARLAGVSTSAIVDFLLSEVLRDDSLAVPLPQPAAPPAPPRPPGRPARRPAAPARVIPLSRARTRRLGLGTAVLAEIRRHGRELCRHSREVRQRAESACRRAARARALAEVVRAGPTQAL